MAEATVSFMSKPRKSYSAIYALFTHGCPILCGRGPPARVETPGDEHDEGCSRSWLPQLFNVSLVPHLLVPIFGQQCRIKMTILYLYIASHENIPKEFEKDLASKLPGIQ